MMFGRSITLFKICGFDIKADLSWLILAALITWSLASGWFPEYYKNLPKSSYWLMGTAGTCGLFLSVILHELAHSLVARRFGVIIRSITLFIFGGVAQMEDDPPSAGAEFWMAIVGPAFSAILCVFMFLTAWWGELLNWPVTVVGVFSYLAWLNLVLAGFNLAPAFPLDGGRILRSMLWRWKKDLQWATSVAANIGTGLGIILAATGIFFLIKGNFLIGLWWLMLGFFVRLAAQGSYRQMLLRSLFHHVKVRDIMAQNPVVVSRTLSLEDFVYDYFYRDHYRLYPVISFGKFSGCVNVDGVFRVPQEDWASRTVSSVAEPCSSRTAIGPDESADAALAVMNKTGNHRLLVVDGEQLAGVIALEDILKLMSKKEYLKNFEKKGQVLGNG